MKDLEDRVREELDRRAGGDPFRSMPAGTIRRIRARQGRTALTAALAVSMVVGGVVALAHAVPGQQGVGPAGAPTTGGTQLTPLVPASPSVRVTPSGSSSPGWRKVHPPATWLSISPSFGPWPKVVPNVGSPAYVDHQSDDPSYLITPKIVIAYGTVDGIPFSATAFQQNGKVFAPYDGPPGPCADVFAGPDGDLGGSTACLYVTTPPQPTDMHLEGFIWGSNDMVAYQGVLSTVVARVQVRLDDGEVRDVDLLPGPPGVGANFFILFPPRRASGTVVAKDQDGKVLATAPLCEWNVQIAPDGNSGGPCGT